MVSNNDIAFVADNEAQLSHAFQDNPLLIHELSFNILYDDPGMAQVTVTVPQSLVDSLYRQAALFQREHIQTYGFSKGQIPLEYILQNFKSNLTHHIKEFLLKYCVMDFLFAQIHQHKILMVGDLRLINIHIEPASSAQFVLEFSVFNAMPPQEWKYLPFKSPKRKNYKDLDRQVEGFIEEEKEFLKTSALNTLTIGDWVCFDIALLDEQENAVLGEHKTHVWLKLGDEEADNPFHELFLNRTIGDSFITNNKSLQDYFSNSIDTAYRFKVTIQDLLKGTHFCLDQFKQHFKLKTNKELYQRLIEVFSYRNDISLRRSIAEEALKILLSKHRFTVPNYLVLRQQKNIMDKIKLNPDYHVYRVQRDFNDRVRQLAEKQIRETVFLDQLVYNENLNAQHIDIKSYLNLSNRARMKDFLYFDMPSSKLSGQEAPLSHQELKRYCLREKALNHIIYHLTKK